VALDAADRAVVSRTLPGRGAWVCRASPSCFATARTKRSFERALRRPLALGSLDELEKDLVTCGFDPGNGGAKGVRG
jgi:predicted RNA-binding protein YlxR (DUF448 family)